jgi:hypothetical protein
VVVILMSPVWLQKQYGFAPAVTLQANSIATIMLCIGCLLAGLAADRFGASAPLSSAACYWPHQAGRFTIWPAAILNSCSCCTAWWGCAWALWARCLTSWCALSRRKCASPASHFPTTSRMPFLAG